MAGPRDWILRQLDAEQGRWMLWLPVAMGLGIAIYFELPSEPALWLGPALAAAGCVAASWRLRAARRVPVYRRGRGAAGLGW
jgi:competence protein ComEC